ncbi:MAG: hypothetical protein ABSA93_07930 [Streptosporangiaceae bacterium]
MSGSQSVMSGRPVSVAVTVTWPTSLIVTGTVAEARVRVPSTRSTVSLTLPAGTMAASTVVCTTTCRALASRTLTGLANTSARKICGTARRLTSR